MQRLTDSPLFAYVQPLFWTIFFIVCVALSGCAAQMVPPQTCVEVMLEPIPSTPDLLQSEISGMLDNNVNRSDCYQITLTEERTLSWQIEPWSQASRSDAGPSVRFYYRENTPDAPIISLQKSASGNLLFIEQAPSGIYYSIVKKIGSAKHTRYKILTTTKQASSKNPL